MFGNQDDNFTLVAAGAIPRYHVVQGSGTSGVSGVGGLATAKTQKLVGIALNETQNANEAVAVCPRGRCRAVAGGAITAYAQVTSTTSGRLAACGSGDTILGYALEAAAADGDIIQVFLSAAMDKTSA